MDTMDSRLSREADLDALANALGSLSFTKDSKTFSTSQRDKLKQAFEMMYEVYEQSGGRFE